ncbi:DMSO/TMAO reductase YedYZ molybdopterin-dependent catalytic subunit [Methylopila capsulata]|uniref:DMSO/TMAO reductase YedYZ molybdopterin-dependent catalytic subunit n=1 Tax=Methylopila capsulata TaxID=61654 RepID=A0A9W6ITV7_9HYPH|nr:molybdopterin-dependent oxidoreductase [Methylopila capsulata]MBM7852211.1 DMSO/TMAO reductase YedYZ molybdopterin-dependent catalytic subunit [Methylopila capsulata]GLK56417.1 hypothetical protein GCM10008170_24360 [Methylopila capsulata]
MKPFVFAVSDGGSEILKVAASASWTGGASALLLPRRLGPVGRVGLTGADVDPGEHSVAKAMEEHTLLFAMNSEPLPNIHGGPLRLVVPGWPASASHKWLTRITLRDKEHDGQGMTGRYYGMPEQPLIPGSKGDGVKFKILESTPIRAATTSPANGTQMPAGARGLKLCGVAWGGTCPSSAPTSRSTAARPGSRPSSRR